MKNLKITKGEWKVTSKNVKNCFYYITAKDSTSKSNRNIEIVLLNRGQHPDKSYLERALADAQLIADAGTTANKCGKLPSELLAERDELISALKSCVLSMQAHPDNEENSEFEGFINKGWDAINKTLSK